MARVLIVEDGPELRTLMEVRLRQSGHRVNSAASGEEALEMLTGKDAPDVAVLDVLLPGMTGLELHGWLRRDPALARIPVIFLSSRIQPADIEAGRRLGATYLTKPIVISALNRAIDSAVASATADTGGW